MIKITLRPPVSPREVLWATGKKPYLDKLTYCLNLKTVGELETTANLLKEIEVDIQSWEEIEG